MYDFKKDAGQAYIYRVKHPGYDGIRDKCHGDDLCESDWEKIDCAAKYCGYAIYKLSSSIADSANAVCDYSHYLRIIKHDALLLIVPLMILAITIINIINTLTSEDAPLILWFSSRETQALFWGCILIVIAIVICKMGSNLSFAIKEAIYAKRGTKSMNGELHEI
jgi:hypothetical protein